MEGGPDLTFSLSLFLFDTFERQSGDRFIQASERERKERRSEEARDSYYTIRIAVLCRVRQKYVAAAASASCSPGFEIHIE